MIISSESASLRHQLVMELQKQGAISSRVVAAVFEAIPRELFVPLFYRREGGTWQTCSRDGEKGMWLRQIYQDEALVTLLDARGLPTGSSSQPTEPQILSLITVMIPFLVAFAGWLYQRVISFLPANKQVIIMQIAQLAVHAAEQVGKDSSGAAKKKIAQDFIINALASLGIRLDPTIIDSAIEGQVYRLNQEQVAKQPGADQSSVNAG